jgi:hypothetical protein
MKCEAVVQNYNALLEMERYVDGGAKTYSALAARTEAATRYRPESSASSFDLVVLNAPEDRVGMFKADPSPGLLDHFVREQIVRFPVHPHTFEDRALPGRNDLHPGKPCETSGARGSKSAFRSAFPSHGFRRQSRQLRRCVHGGGPLGKCTAL